DTVVVNDGRIAAVGKYKDCDVEGADRIIDCRGTTLAPGLIDSHVHPVAG
ncbi:MAG TPA: Enamidase, partial [Pusillimonas sp.]|nr:Enamidase [Pusillimonas sp.]